MKASHLLLTLMLGLAITGSAFGAGPIERRIANPLNLDWPWELVSMQVPKGEASGITSVRLGDQVRPVQSEAVDDQTNRLWFVATIRPLPKPAKGQSLDDTSTPIAFVSEPVDSSLKVERGAGAITVDNGLIAVRFTDCHDLAGKKLSDSPGPLQGIVLSGGGPPYGRWRWLSEAVITDASTQIIQQGPVFVDVRIRYELQGAANGIYQGTNCFYELMARVVMGDPWVQVRERYRLPSDATYELELKEHLQPDTVMWIPWFGFERFGGNSELRFHPLQPQNKQRGSFVLLRPAWNQMPGGGQDFFVTRGGEKGDPAAPAVGVVATHASWWRNPYAQTIASNVEGGDTARIRFPVNIGARAYALVAGPRRLFDSMDRMNSLVRRHADWTLDDQINKRVLEWPRDPSKTGPHVLMTREQLERIQSAWQANRDTPETRVLKSYANADGKLSNLDKDLFDVVTGKPIKAARVPTAQLFLERRYQDDFLNPTGRTVRDMDDLFALADLANAGKSWAGPWQAAVAEIFTDTNHWPGWLNEWRPANPNFNTDKYTVCAYAAAAMADHPHAKQWMDFAVRNFQDDVGRVLIPPDGVGAECPGYSGYSLEHQLRLAKVFMNNGVGNLVADNALFKKNGEWHRQLLTPVDVRLKHRHEAPIGDTHKWTSGANDAFGMLATFYKDRDPAFAGEMMGVWQLLRSQYLKGSLATDLLFVDQSIQPTPVEKLEWGSHAFKGFGSVMRSRFGGAKETFVTFRAGEARGHYHNDDLSFHFYGCGTPLSLDYNCSYTPRGDHAALHNSMTFGEAKPFTHIGETAAVNAMEQIDSSAKLIAFASTANADAVVGERTDDTLVLTPVDPGDAKFQYAYPQRKVSPITHRRTLVLVKHSAGSKLNDYLVIRDDTRCTVRQFLNLHLLARDVSRDGQLIRATGQWDTDATVYLASKDVKNVTMDRWFYFDEWMSGPGIYLKKGDKEGEATHAEWVAKIKQSDGQALIPPKGWDKEWKVGEYQKWIRVETAPGSALTWILYPRKQGESEPTFATTASGGVTVSLETETETVELSPTQSTIDRGGQRQIIVTVPAIESQ